MPPKPRRHGCPGSASTSRARGRSSPTGAPEEEPAAATASSEGEVSAEEQARMKAVEEKAPGQGTGGQKSWTEYGEVGRFSRRVWVDSG